MKIDNVHLAIRLGVRFLLILSSVLVLTCCTAPGTISPQPSPTNTPSASPTPGIPAIITDYVNEAIIIMQANSYYRDRVDWEKVQQQAMDLIRNGKVPSDAYSAIQYVLRYEVRDMHAYLLDPSQVSQYNQATLDENPQSSAALVMDRYGYLVIPMFASGDLQVVQDYVTHLQDLIRELDTSSPCGWVVDLRSNGGGNMWAMLAGLGPVIGEGKLGAFEYGDGRLSEWNYEDGQIKTDSGIVIGVRGLAYQLSRQDVPVAVLTGYDTLSSGEAVAIAFKGRPNTRSFGQGTGGFATAIELFPLSDGAFLGITTALFADRTGEIYSGSILPDEVIATSLGVPLSGGIFIPQEALDWLASQPSCTNH